MLDSDIETRALHDALRARVAAVEKAAVDTVRRYKEQLDAEHAERVKSLESRRPDVSVYPQLESRPEVHVNVAALPVDLVIKALKDLAEAATAMPVPVVQQPEQNIVVEPAPVVVDLVQVELLVGTLTNWVVQASEDAVANRELTLQLAGAFQALTTALMDMGQVNEQLLTVLSRPRPQRAVEAEISDDGRHITVRG